MNRDLIKMLSVNIVISLLIVMVAASSLKVQAQSAYNMAAELNAAAATGDIQTAKSVLDSGLDVNYKRSDQTALHFAISFKRAEMVRFLLSRGADPNITNGDGLNALQQAQKGGNAEIVQIIRQALRSGDAVPDAVPLNTKPQTRPGGPNPVTIGPLVPAGSFGRFKVGDIVLHSRDRGKTWERGTVLKIDAEHQMYLIENERKTVQNYYDGVFVTTLERRPSWTNFFFGDWDLTLPMTANDRVRGNDVNLVFSGADRLPPLRIKPDGSYLWVIDKHKVIQGRWRANENGPGLVLLNGDRGDDWNLYNTSDATERSISNTDTVRLVSGSDKYTPKYGFRIKKK